MKLILRDFNSDVVFAWSQYFGPHEDVSFGSGNLLKADCDAIVVALNTDGDIVGKLAREMMKTIAGPSLQQQVKDAIQEQHLGSMMVGDAVLVDTGARYLRWVIGAVTSRDGTHRFMSVPFMVRPDPLKRKNANTALAATTYKAMTSILEVAHAAQPSIQRLGITGLGTGHADGDTIICAENMHKAFLDFTQRHPSSDINAPGQPKSTSA